tara:strand:+ start:497 stop:646 length:150 start_codon:yes stop_codon:yes gene_type:complete
MYECLRHVQLHEAFDFEEVEVYVDSRLDRLFFVVELFVVDFLASVVTFL